MRNVNWESSKTDMIILLPSKRVQRTPVKVSTVDSRREFSVLEGNERRTSPRRRSALLLGSKDQNCSPWGAVYPMCGQRRHTPRRYFRVHCHAYRNSSSRWISTTRIARRRSWFRGSLHERHVVRDLSGHGVWRGLEGS